MGIFETIMADAERRIAEAPHGLTIGVVDDFGQLGPGGRRSWTLVRWGDDGLGDTVGTFPTARDAAEVRALAIEYIDRHGHDAERACATAIIEYRESLEAAI